MFAWLTSETFDIRKRAEMAARLRGMGFMFHEYCPEYDKDGQYLYNEFQGMRPEKRILMEWDKSTACMEHGVRGTREHGVIMEEIDQIPPQLFAPKVQGKPAYSAGKVFSEWKEDVYVITEEKAVEMVRWLGGTLYTATDPHATKPNYTIFGFVLPTGKKDKDGRDRLTKVFVDEWPTFEEGAPMPRDTDWFRNAMAPLPTYLHCLQDGVDFADDGAKFARVLSEKTALVLGRFRGDGKGSGSKVYHEVPYHLVDPRPAATKSAQTGNSLKGYYNEVGAQYGLWFKSAVVEHQIMHRIGRLREEMADGLILVSQRCRNLSFVLRHLFYMPQVIRGAYTNRLSDEIDPDMKHIFDALCYFCQKADPTVAQMVHIPPPAPQPERERPRGGYEHRLASPRVGLK